MKTKVRPLRLNFDRRFKLKFQRATINSDAGSPASRELDETHELSPLAAKRLAERVWSAPRILTRMNAVFLAKSLNPEERFSMKRKRFTEEQIALCLRQAESGTPVDEIRPKEA